MQDAGTSEARPHAPDLAPTRANFAPLTPLSFLRRAETFFADRTAVIHGARSLTYAGFTARCRRLASALAGRGVRAGDTVAILSPNAPAMLEAHYAVPWLGAVLNPLNTRLDAASIAFCLAHGGAKALLVDTELAPLAREALSLLGRDLLVVDIADPEAGAAGERVGAVEYEVLLAEGDPAFDPPGPRDEWDSICLLYTSGTTGDPKGVVYSHRGAAITSLSNALAFGFGPDSVYLWTLPMFHCSGWTCTWAVTAVGGTHVCLRRVEPAAVFRLIADHGVSHLCGAPTVLTMLANAPAEARRPLPGRVVCVTGGAAPPSPVIGAMDALGFQVVHAWGTTECYGPGSLCIVRPEWAALPDAERHRLMARQGVPMPAVEALRVADPDTLAPVPRDGLAMGELVMRGNTLMKGYLDNPAATARATAGGWYRTGDLAVWHEDATVEIKDRSKDVIISGGENIASLEVEEVLTRHPAVLEAAVVAKADPHWGEVPCAFVTLKEGTQVGPDEILAHCRAGLARFKVPKAIVFGPLPKTSTGKVQKFELRRRLQEEA